MAGEDQEGESKEPVFAESKGKRGVSMDQDGKSNTWAIEPKMTVYN